MQSARPKWQMPDMSLVMVVRVGETVGKEENEEKKEGTDEIKGKSKGKGKEKGQRSNWGNNVENGQPALVSKRQYEHSHKCRHVPFPETKRKRQPDQPQQRSSCFSSPFSLPSLFSPPSQLPLVLWAPFHPIRTLLVLPPYLPHPTFRVSPITPTLSSPTVDHHSRRRTPLAR
jgi:hypothetical protein